MPARAIRRQSGFDITSASEVMVILALSTDLHDLRARVARIVVGYTFDGELHDLLPGVPERLLPGIASGPRSRRSHGAGSSRGSSVRVGLEGG